MAIEWLMEGFTVIIEGTLACIDSVVVAYVRDVYLLGSGEQMDVP